MSVRFETFDCLRRDRESPRDFKGNRRASPLQIKVNRAQTQNILMKSITLFAILTLASFHQSLLLASAADQQTGDKEAIFNNAKAFVDAFEKGDASAVAGFWAEDGEFVDLTGRRLQGRHGLGWLGWLGRRLLTADKIRV